MKKPNFLIFFAIAFLLLAVSSHAIPVKFTVKATGKMEVTTQNETIVENCSLNPDTNLTECVNETIVQNSTATQPWSDSASVEIECGSVCTYPMPNFEEPENVRIAKYEIRYNSTEVMIFFDSTKNQATSDPNDKIRVEVAKKSNQVVLDRISPAAVKEGISQINVFVRNNGSTTIDYFNLTIIGVGIADSFAETSDTLEPGELGIVPVILNISGSGEKEFIVKISWSGDSKSLSSLYVTRLNVLPGEKPGPQINSTEIISRFNADKDTLRNYESEYSLKKSQGYLVSEVYDSIKDARDYVASVQLLVEEEKFAEAKTKLSLLELSLDDIRNSLQNALKTQQTFFDRLKSNALLISTIVAALAGVISLYERQRIKLARLKERIREKKSGGKGSKEPAGAPKKAKPKKQKPKNKSEEESAPLPEIVQP